jgi:pto-interacting protein 1
MGRWWASAKRVFGDRQESEDDGEDRGSVGCFPRIARKLSRNSYAHTPDPGTFRAAPFSTVLDATTL